MAEQTESETFEEKVGPGQWPTTLRTAPGAGPQVEGHRRELPGSDRQLPQKPVFLAYSKVPASHCQIPQNS